MQTYPVDIDPVQLVRWLVAEQDAQPAAFRIRASQSCEVRPLPVRQEHHLGDQEREDLSEVVTIATLEIAPARASEHWLLTVQVEDEIGPREAGEDVAVGSERRIDVGTFYSKFIRPGRGTAVVLAEAQDEAAAKRMQRVLATVESNRHEPRHRTKKAK